MLKKILCLFALCLAASFSCAEPVTDKAESATDKTEKVEPATNKAEPAKDKQDLNGIWSDASSQAFQYCYLIIAQEGSTLHTAHYLEFRGTPMVEYGIGSVKDGDIKLQVKVTKPIPGWATAGVHTLHLSEDGNVLRGEYTDDKGNKGALAYGRLRQKP